MKFFILALVFASIAYVHSAGRSGELKLPERPYVPGLAPDAEVLRVSREFPRGGGQGAPSLVLPGGKEFPVSEEIAEKFNNYFRELAAYYRQAGEGSQY